VPRLADEGRRGMGTARIPRGACCVPCHLCVCATLIGTCRIHVVQAPYMPLRPGSEGTRIGRRHRQMRACARGARQAWRQHIGKCGPEFGRTFGQTRVVETPRGARARRRCSWCCTRAHKYAFPLPTSSHAPARTRTHAGAHLRLLTWHLFLVPSGAGFLTPGCWRDYEGSVS
jgi:hypothetical protein